MTNLAENFEERLRKAKSHEATSASVVHAKIGDLETTDVQFENIKKEETAENLPDKRKGKEQGIRKDLEQGPESADDGKDKPTEKIDAKKITEEDSTRLSELREKLSRPKEHDEEFRRIVIQEWEALCQEFLNTFWNGFSQRELTSLEKSQRFIFGEYPWQGSTTNIAIGNVEIYLNKQDTKLRDFYEKGITDVGTIFEQAPKIKAAFNQPQLWKEAERRAKERQK